jgi:trans-aconitate methyltransferase
MGQTWDPLLYDVNARFVADLASPLLQCLNAKPGMRILDLGCGDGVLTCELMNRGADVLGVDASPAMVQAAKSHGVHAMVEDGHTLPFQEEFHAVFSNAALHWMVLNPQEVANHVYQALLPNGRFVAEMGGRGNIAIIREVLTEALIPYHLNLHDLHPVFFPSENEYRVILENAGFEIEEMILFERKTPLNSGLAAWVQTFAKGIMDAIPQYERMDFLESVEILAKPRLFDEQGWWADYVRLRFIAYK